MEQQILDTWVYWYSLGHIVGSATVFAGYGIKQYWRKKKSEKMAKGLKDMAKGIDEEELDL